VRAIAVVGGSVAGLRAAEALRIAGFEGQLHVVSAELSMPYERPELSKDFLLGKSDQDDLRLRDDEDYDELGADWLMGKRAARLDPGSRALMLDGGKQLVVDGVVIATGAAARSLPALSPWRSGMFSLRSLEDAVALRDALADHPRVVVVGGGLIGTELASVCHAMGLDVTVIEPEPVPMRRVLGRDLATLLGAAHRDSGVTLRCREGIEAVLGSDRVKAVRMTSGLVAECDVLVVAVGAEPQTAWLDGSSVLLDDGVRCTSSGATSVPNVVACGDVASWFDPNVGRHRRGQHWTTAQEQPEFAATALLSPEVAVPFTALPYFWTEQHGMYVQVAGYVSDDSELRVLEGSIEERCLHGELLVDGRVEAVVGVNATSAFSKLQAQLAATVQGAGQPPASSPEAGSVMNLEGP
jgi:3-phenylpropionate/trans-cinnamate dioxygenase ferredoxin reductase subunit